MSADNFYLIRKDRQGFFVPVMGFASDEVDEPDVRARHPRFKQFDDALQCAMKDYAEYGVSVHPECHSDEPAQLVKNAKTGHYSSCPAPWNDFLQGDDPYEPYECCCELVEAEWAADYTDAAQ